MHFGNIVQLISRNFTEFYIIFIGNHGKPHNDLPCKTIYPSQYVKRSTFSNEIEKVDRFTE